MLQEGVTQKFLAFLLTDFLVGKLYVYRVNSSIDSKNQNSFIKKT